MGDAVVPDEDPFYGTITVVGGGCYGSYYVRQLLRARDAGKLRWVGRLVVVDRNAECEASRRYGGDIVLALEEWAPYFTSYLDGVAAAPEPHQRDAIVPSPLMPHLLFDWVVQRSRTRWPDRRVTCVPPAAVEGVPWQREGADATRYVSFATWTCPVNCIEPRICPHTKGERTWSFPPTLTAHVEAERRAGRALEGPALFRCTHRAHGVGMIDVDEVLAADRLVAAVGAHRAARVLVGTVSHCHGALGELAIE